ncbi:DNA polymerase delta, subunit 4-domain-containing protein [Desarmillaria tabescens]|uniref:DNA polymerase delta, subunit 4-domain-containing protein n=1 Tax=Armillaria tabescens TaxID=1929756 RepID=A0AA39NJJ9_ARMTA|nr:DNA polymerase delta, subunit 4-domain-containing protein [Desarmillaria tabescens]KAK0466833.1 DNA polymerase delta, subunit 4-domain-containing protein [Desarmillaria tabescens]
MPRSKSTSTLRQQRLSFATSKRTSSSGNKKPTGNPKTVVLDSVNEIDLSSSEDEDEEVQIVRSPHKDKRAVVGSSIKNKGKGKADETGLVEGDPKWKSIYSAYKKKSEVKEPIHGEDQDDFHEILRVFDLSYEFGPCIGVTRLERWERASKMGLNPPPEIHDILTTRQGRDRSDYAQNVFYGQV